MRVEPAGPHVQYPILQRHQLAQVTLWPSLAKNHAERALSKLLRTVDEGEHVDPSRITVREWLELWVATTRAEVAPKTHERYAEIVRCYLIPGLGGLRLHRLSPADIQRAYNEFPRDPAPRTRRHIHRILKSALKRAVEQQALARNPADAITRLPKVERQPSRC